MQRSMHHSRKSLQPFTSKHHILSAAFISNVRLQAIQPREGGISNGDSGEVEREGGKNI
jgi:hypothetical protein